MPSAPCERRRRSGLTDRDGAARGRGIASPSPRRRRRAAAGGRARARRAPASPSRAATGVPPTLDDVFLALTGRTLREAGEGEPTRRRTHDGCRDADDAARIREDRSEPMTTTDTRPDTARAAEPGARHLERADPRAAAGRARSVHADLQPGAAARVPRAVRAAADRLVRAAGRARRCSGSCPACSS